MIQWLYQLTRPRRWVLAEYKYDTERKAYKRTAWRSRRYKYKDTAKSDCEYLNTLCVYSDTIYIIIKEPA